MVDGGNVTVAGAVEMAVAAAAVVLSLRWSGLSRLRPLATGWGRSCFLQCRIW